MLGWQCLLTREYTLWTDLSNYCSPTFCGCTCCKCDNLSFRDGTQIGVPRGCKRPRSTSSKREVSGSTAELLEVTLGFSQQDSVSHRRVFIPEAFNEPFILSRLWLNDHYGFRLQIIIIKKYVLSGSYTFFLSVKSLKLNLCKVGKNNRPNGFVMSTYWTFPQLCSLNVQKTSYEMHLEKVMEPTEFFSNALCRMHSQCPMLFPLITGHVILVIFKW